MNFRKAYTVKNLNAFIIIQCYTFTVFVNKRLSLLFQVYFLLAVEFFS
jgi:hypothetical protein